MPDTSGASSDLVVEYVLEPSYPFRPQTISAVTLEMTGFSAEEYLANPTLFASRVHPEDWGRVVALFASLQASDSAAAEYRFMHRQGGYRWLRDELTLVRDDTGEPLEIRARTLDVSARRRTDAALVGREEYFRRLIERASDVFIVMALDGTIRYESPSVRRIAGFTSDEIIGRNAYEFVHPDDVGELKRQLGLALSATRDLVPAEFRHRCADGSWRYVEAVASRLVEDEQVTGAIVNMRDIGDRKRLEEQLQQARKMEAIGRLAGGVAHDFNNLLTAVIGYSELLLDRMPADSPYREDVGQIREAGESAATLTRQLLAFSRRQLLEPRQLDLNALLTETTTMVRRVVGEDVECVTEFDSALGPVHADAGQLEQVLFNLCMNAREAMPTGGRLVVRTERLRLATPRQVRFWTVPPGTYTVLTVSDSGVGMPDEVLRQVFEPFFTTKPRSRGAGLGLSSVYGIVAQSGGHVAVNSAPDHGTSVSIYLPEVPAETQPSTPALPVGVMTGATILLVEDNSLLGTFAQNVLRSSGYHVLAASSASEAEVRADGFNGHIDLLLTDVVMPGPSGVALAERLAARRPAMKTLFTSGYTEDALLRHGIVAGSVAFLPKPFTARVLLQKVNDVLAGAPADPSENRHPLD